MAFVWICSPDFSSYNQLKCALTGTMFSYIVGLPCSPSCGLGIGIIAGPRLMRLILTFLRVHVTVIALLYTCIKKYTVIAANFIFIKYKSEIKICIIYFPTPSFFPCQTRAITSMAWVNCLWSYYSCMHMHGVGARKTVVASCLLLMRYFFSI